MRGKGANKGRATRRKGAIADLKRAEKALRANEQRYDLAMSAINEGVYDWDIAANTIFYSDRVYEALRTSRDDTTPNDWRIRIHPEDLPRYDTALVAHFKGETKRFECDIRYRGDDGKWYWARQHGVAIRDKKGRAVRMIGSTGDITELKRIEHALKESEERYALATRAATEGIYEWNLETGSLYLSDRSKAFFAVEGEELMPAAWNARVHGEDFQGYRDAIAAYLKGRTPQFEHEYRIRNAAGGYSWVVDRALAVRNAAGRVTRLVGALTDVTQRKLAEIELRRRTAELSEALEQQTATADILRAISSSQTDLQPVFDTIIRNCVRLGNAGFGSLFHLNADGRIDIGAHYNFDPRVEALFRAGFPHPVSKDIPYGKAMIEGAAVNVADFEASGFSPASKERARALGVRAVLAVPLMRQGRAIGAIAIGRPEPGAFADSYVSLIKTFADQAVIAIENVRLFNETKEALEQQKASADVLSVISSSIADTGPVFDKILESCQRLFSGMRVGINLVGDDGSIHLGAYQGPGREAFEKVFPLPMDRNSGSGLCILERRVLHYPDIEAEGVPDAARRGQHATGSKAGLFAPMLWQDKAIGVVFIARGYAGPFSEKEIALLKTFADQAVIAIQNARLFREIQEKSAQLEVANKHKSDFLANMSHELRTPLNAIIGFSEVLTERMFGEVNEKQAEYLKDIHESGRHLLSLINDILDLSKIEAGRMELELSAFHLPTAVANAMTLVRERAQRHGIALGAEIDPALGAVEGDERKVKQILLNLLSNAVKFTPDGGRVDVRAKAADGRIEIEVRDTGIGIAPEDQAAVFEEFKQVGRDYTRKAEGTGLGLALTRRLVELHGGDIALESAPGKGSTFTVRLPLR